jgi:hypothetical protein
MLSDDDLKRIAAEEHYRHTVRRTLEAEAAAPPAPPPPPPKHGLGKRVFDFFNSSVGMWLLSSVVLTGGAAVLQQIQHNHEIAQQHRQTRLTHRFEIEHRLDSMAFQLRRAKTVGEAKAALDSIFKSPVPLTPELQNRSLASLYLALHPLLVGEQRQKAKQAITLVKRLEEAELSLHGSPDNSPLSPDQRNHMVKLITSIHDLELTKAGE